jgi:hypothetical protein
MNTDPRRICLVTETYPPEINGVALTLARLAGGLRARGHAVSWCAPASPAMVPSGHTEDSELTLVSGSGRRRLWKCAPVARAGTRRDAGTSGARI